MTKFGLLLSTDNWLNMEADAQEAEALGLHSLWVDDHLLHFNKKNPENKIEAWTGLTSLVNKTTKIRLGNLVLCNSFRNPALLGKMVASLDVISKGRLELGIGAGWYEEEYKAYGFEFLPLGKRINQLRETLEILQLMFKGESFDYQGSYWTLDQCLSLPKPIQRSLPIWIGGIGPKMIRLAVKYGTGINITSLPPKEFNKVIETVNKVFDEQGKKDQSFLKSYMTFVHFTKDMEERETVIDYLHETWYPQPPRDAFETLLIGPADLVREKASYYIDNANIDLFIANVKGTESIKDPIQLFHDEIQKKFH